MSLLFYKYRHLLMVLVCMDLISVDATAQSDSLLLSKCRLPALTTWTSNTVDQSLSDAFTEMAGTEVGWFKRYRYKNKSSSETRNVNLVYKTADSFIISYRYKAGRHYSSRVAILSAEMELLGVLELCDVVIPKTSVELLRSLDKCRHPTDGRKL
jgi:hypothetical protein